MRQFDRAEISIVTAERGHRFLSVTLISQGHEIGPLAFNPAEARQLAAQLWERADVAEAAKR